MKLIDCSVGQRIEFWVNIEYDGSLIASETPTQWTNITTLVFIDIDHTCLVAWKAREITLKDPNPIANASRIECQKALEGFDSFYWLRKDLDIFRVYGGRGLNCAGRYCNEYNDYAQINTPEGLYLCWSCRDKPTCLR